MQNEMVEELLKRYHGLKGSRGTWEHNWQEIADYISPRRADFTTIQEGGNNRQRRIKDSTGQRGAEQLASGIHGMLTSPYRPWFNLVPRDQTILRNYRVGKWIHNATKVMMDYFNSSSSLFSLAAHELYLDVVAFGTGVMYVEEDVKNGPVCSTFHLKDCYLLEDSNGRVDSVFRKFKMTHRNVIKRWAKKYPPDQVEFMEKRPDEEKEIIHCVMPNSDYKAKALGKKGKLFSSVYIDCDKKILLEEGGYNEMPYMTPRWSKLTTEIYGRGPGFVALPDVKMLNVMTDSIVRYAQRVAEPMIWLPDDGYMFPINSGPNAVNFYRAGTQDEIRTLPNTAQPQVAERIIEKAMQSVNSTFFLDFLQLRESPQMTATEVLQRRDEQFRLMSPVLARLQTEFLEPLIDRFFGILMRRGAFGEEEDVPQELMATDLTIDYLSPMAIAQRSTQSDDLVRFMQISAPIMQVDPTAAIYLNSGEAIKYVHSMTNLPVEVLRTDEEVQQIKDQQMQAQQTMMQMEMLTKGGAAVKDLAKADKDSRTDVSGE